jgi:hypothetical protein
MENKLMNCLEQFAANLQEISPKGISEMEIILPYDNYRQLEFEYYQIDHTFKLNMYEVPKNKVSVRTINGIQFNISCKEYNDVEIQKKLKQCFEILRK